MSSDEEGAVLVEALRYAAEPHGIYVYMTMSALWEGKFKCKRNCERRPPVRKNRPHDRPPPAETQARLSARGAVVA